MSKFQRRLNSLGGTFCLEGEHPRPYCEFMRHSSFLVGLQWCCLYRNATEDLVVPLELSCLVWDNFFFKHLVFVWLESGSAGL